MDAEDGPGDSPTGEHTDSAVESADDALEWGYGPLAAAQSAPQCRSPYPAADPGVHDQATAPSSGVEHHGALARAAAVRAAGGRRRQMHRRKKEKKTGFKASELLSRQPDQREETATAHDAVRVSEPSLATRQPFGAVPTTHRRRTGGGSRVGSGASDTTCSGGASRHGSPGAVPMTQPAQGFAGLTAEQLAVVRDIFEHVDSGNKGWLCRDDVLHIVRTVNNSDTTHPRRVEPSHDTAGGPCNQLSRTRPQAQHDQLPRLGCPPRGAPIDAESEREQRKQDSAREPTSPVPDDTARYCRSPDDARWASHSAMTEDEIEQQIKQAEKEQMRDARHRRKLADRETAATVELLKVLVPPDSVELRQAGGAGAEPPVRLSFDTFSKAIDAAMVRTSIVRVDTTKVRVGGGRRDQGGTTTGARPGELYCRKMVTHWRQARGGYDRSNHLGSGDSATHGAEASAKTRSHNYAQMLELLVPMNVREASEALEEEFL